MEAALQLDGARLCAHNRPTLDNAAEQAASGDEHLLRQRHAGQRLLLAEDNPVNREVAEDLLRSCGLVVETAFDGGRAVEMALSRPYDLILMDVQMPVMDGMEAARAIRTRTGRAVPIIAMTANAFVEDREACIEAGMNDHVAKPLDPALMFATLLRWMPLPRRAPAPAAAGPETAPDAQASVRERLAAVEDIVLAHALQHMGGQLPILVRVLRRFADTYQAGLPLLLDLSGDEREGLMKWRAACHSVRGALSTIGADALTLRVTQFERDMLATDASRAALAREAQALHGDVLRLVQRVRGAIDG